MEEKTTNFDEFSQREKKDDPGSIRYYRGFFMG